ncbi:MAG: type 1 glutamine amidotransferase [Gammaproteobacteria bacterium]|nr:MAG: type 1 glutamine amidotransferase [Gammaproteobacteria bacterium]
MAPSDPSAARPAATRPVLVLRHIDCEGPGYLAQVLDRHGVPWRVVAVDEGEPVPRDPGEAAGLVLMGGPMSANDPLPWIEEELALLRAAREAGLPLLGHCLGGQLIARALGGRVGPNRVKEIGWHEVRRVDTPCPPPGDWADELAAWREALPERFTAFHWHGERFTPPPGAARLLESAGCPEQAFVLPGGVLGLQCHLEMTPELVAAWVERYAHELREPGPTVQGRAEILRDLEARVAALQRVADRVYARWIEHLKG